MADEKKQHTDDETRLQPPTNNTPTEQKAKQELLLVYEAQITEQTQTLSWTE